MEKLRKNSKIKGTDILSDSMLFKNTDMVQQMYQ